MPRTPRVLFLGLGYAGHRTRFLNLRAHTERDRRIRPVYRQVTGKIDGGMIERLPLVPRAVKGRLRATLEAAPIATLPRPDAIWTGVSEVAAPYLWAQLGTLRRPLVHDLDCTRAQLEAFAPVYYGRPSRLGLRWALGRLTERLFWHSVTLFTPWSRWAARALQGQGVVGERIRILPPGVDLGQWQPRRRPAEDPRQPLRLLFVGGDFARKGGQLLLDVLRTHGHGRYELDVVTLDAVAARPGVRVHRAAPNSARLRELYARADLFVLPTRADCFGIAAIEALASGVPVIMGNVGGAGDIVDEAATGWLIEPTAAALTAALERALAQRDRLPDMGRRARQVAEQRFDGQRNDTLVVDLLIEQAARYREARQQCGGVPR